MNLLCPNCQKMLTVPEQYAGQLMKCPLCNGTFTVPSLPTGGAATDPGSLPAPPGPPPLGPVGSSSSAPPGTYGFHPESHAPPPPPLYSPAASEPPPLGPLDPGLPHPQPGAFTSTPSAGSVPPLSGYTRVYPLHLSDKVLQWVPPVAVFLIFVLSWFSWVGLYPGGVPAFTQSAWGIALGDGTPDKDISPVAQAREPMDEKNPTESDKKTLEQAKELEAPGMSLWILFYWLLLLVTVLFTIACAAWGLIEAQVRNQIPHALAQFIPARWGIAALLNVALFLLLLIPVIFGFPLESKIREEAAKKYDPATAKNTVAEKTARMNQGKMIEQVKRTFALDMVVFLHILTLLSAALVFWIQQRGPAWPLPKIELAW